MKTINLFILAALAAALAGCDTPEADHPERGARERTTTTTTSETVQRTPVDAGTTTTTVQHY